MQEKLISGLAGNPKFIPLLQEYLDSIPGTVKSLKERFTSGDREGFFTLCHNIKGTAASYGYPQITSAAVVILDKLKNDVELEELKQDLEEMINLFNRVETNL